MTEGTVNSTAALFLALGDPTRLRLLNLMCQREVCVSSFTTVLGQSQPLVSRHLAYLRNAGVVESRRDGKWIHYSLSKTLDDDTNRLLSELFKWMEGQSSLHEERVKYYESIGMPLPARKSETTRTKTSKRTNSDAPVPKPDADHVRSEAADESGLSNDPPHHEPPDYEPVHHNELEDFLL